MAGDAFHLARENLGCLFSFLGHITCEARNVHKGKNSFSTEGSVEKIFRRFFLSWELKKKKKMITIHRELTNALAIPKECSQEILLCFVFYSNVFQIEVLSLRQKTNPNMRLRKDRSELATDQRRSQIRVKKKWP